MSDPALCVYIFDRRYGDALLDLARLVTPLWGEEKTHEAIEREPGRWLILSASPTDARFFSVDREADVLQFLQTALDETGRAPSGGGHLSVDWRVAPELQRQLQSAIAEHVRRFTTDVVSRSFQ